MTLPTLRRKSTLLPCLGSLVAAATPLAAQDPDYTVARIDLVQVIPNVTLVEGKPMFVRAHVDFTGTQPAGATVDAIARVFVNGVEEPYSPLFSDNGPITPPATRNLFNEDHTINFIFLPPETADLEVTVEVNPPGPNRVPESDFTNNVASNGSRPVRCARMPRITYVPIDYRPSGGGVPNLPDPLLIEPGVGDNFVQGIYPTFDWNYHRSDAPSKLWTSDLSGTGSGLLSSLLVDRNMMSPKPDYIYGWVPGSLPYNGQASGVPGRAGMGNTQTIRHQRTFAHELGHLVGRNHINNTINVNGVDVERHLNITEGLGRMKNGGLFDVMVAGLLTNQAWCYDVNYEFYVSSSTFTCSEEPEQEVPGEHLLVGGLWNRAAGTFELTDTVAFHGAVPTPTVPLASADLAVRVQGPAGVAGTFGWRVNPATDACSGDADSEQGAGPLAPFVVVLPTRVAPGLVERLEVVDPRADRVLASLERSANAPDVRLDAPRRTSARSDHVRLAWEASDADGQPLRHYLRFSPDGERRVNLATGTDRSTLLLDMASLPEVRAGKGSFELLTTDGLRTTRTVVPAIPGGTQESLSAVNPPWTHILTPDDGTSYEYGANVVLHCSGWDLEDRSIEGTSLAWSSDLDGALGTGRLLAVSGLSAGTHVISVTATDSSGLMTTDTSTITVTDRLLPLTPAVLTRNAGANPMSYTASAPSVGTTWTGTVDLSTTGHGSAQLFVFDAPLSLTLGGGQVLLVGGNQVAALPLMSGPQVNLSEPIPNDPGLVGLTFYTQALHVLGVMPFALSNAQDLVVGF